MNGYLVKNLISCHCLVINDFRSVKGHPYGSGEDIAIIKLVICLLHETNTTNLKSGQIISKYILVLFFLNDNRF